MIQIMHEHSYNLNPPHEWYNQDVTSYVQLEIEDDPSMEIWPPPQNGEYCDLPTDLQNEISTENEKDRIQEEHSYNLSNDNITMQIIEHETFGENHDLDHNNFSEDRTERNFSTEVIRQIQQEHLYNLKPPTFEITLDGRIQPKSDARLEDYEFDMLEDDPQSQEHAEFTSDYITEEMKQEIINRLTFETALSDQEEDTDIRDMDLSTFVRICQYEEKALKEIDESLSLKYDASYGSDDQHC